MGIRLVCALALLAGMTGSSRADLAWGVNGHPFTAYPGIPMEEQVGFLADLGAVSYRVNVSYMSHADGLATLVKLAKQHGISVLPVLTPGALDLEGMSAKSLYGASFEFAAQMARRFHRDIKVFELGNEMENFAIIQPCEIRDDGRQYPCEWGPAGGTQPEDYYGPRWKKVSAVLKGLSDGISSVDPSLKRAIGTAGWGHVGAFKRMKYDGIEWEISVWHVYGEDPEWALGILAGYEKPIWITEMNNPLGSYHSEDIQAEELGDMMEKIRELAEQYRVEAVQIYELFDEPYWEGFEASMGLVRLAPTPDGGWTVGEPKPVYDVVKRSIRGLVLEPLAERSCSLDSLSAQAEDQKEHVIYSYCLVLGRIPDGGGLTSWHSALKRRETSIPGMVQAMAESEEFHARFGSKIMSNSTYVAALYRMLLLREADPVGLSSYAEQLDDGTLSRADVIEGLVTSAEFGETHKPLFSEPATTATTRN